MRRKPFKFYCHFCGVDEAQSRLVCGPAAVAICAGCIGRAAAELARTSKDTTKITLAIALDNGIPTIARGAAE